jgi:hypothetical protein
MNTMQHLQITIDLGGSTLTCGAPTETNYDMRLDKLGQNLRYSEPSACSEPNWGLEPLTKGNEPAVSTASSHFSSVEYGSTETSGAKGNQLGIRGRDYGAAEESAGSDTLLHPRDEELNLNHQEK